MIRAIEVVADAEERGIFQPLLFYSKQGRGGGKGNDAENGDGRVSCCEKHAIKVERSAVHVLDERVKDTSNKVCTFPKLYGIGC